MHVATIVGFSILVAAVSLSMLDDVRATEWLTVPLAFLYRNAAEYLRVFGTLHRDDDRGASR